MECDEVQKLPQKKKKIHLTPSLTLEGNKKTLKSVEGVLQNNIVRAWEKKKKQKPGL